MRTLVPLVLVTACSVQTSLSRPTHGTSAAAAAPLADPTPATAATCDAARNHCLPEGTQFVQGSKYENDSIRACAQRDGVWYSILHPDSVCDGRTLHRTDPAGAITVGATVVVFVGHGKDGLPADEEGVRRGRWALRTVESIDREAGTFRPGTYRLAGARLVVESHALE